MEATEWPPRITFTLEGAIGLWARAHDAACTKEDVDDLAEALRRLHANDPKFMEPTNDES